MTSEKKIEAQIEELKAKKQDLRGKRIWRCNKCNRGKRISNLDLIVMKYYVSPYG